MRRLATAIIITMSLVAGPASPAQSALVRGFGCAQTTTADIEVCFNEPGGSSSGAIVEAIRGRLALVLTGGEIRLSVYQFTLDGIANDLVKAAERGVNVFVAVDEWTKNYGVWDILSAADTKYSNMTVINCGEGRGCMTASNADAINHTKFIAIRYGASLPVLAAPVEVIQTSANFTAGQQNSFYNNLVAVKNDRKLYGFYEDFHERMMARDWLGWDDDDKDRYGDGSGDGPFNRAWAFPRDSGDPLLTVLNNVTGCGENNAKVWLAYSSITPDNAVRKPVFDRLVELQNDLRCNVKIIVQTADQMEDVKDTGIKASNVKYTGGDYKLHHKFTLIDTLWDGTNEAHEFVFTGSHNLTEGALRAHDETMMRVENAWAFNRYQEHYDELWTTTRTTS